ncbi:MAG: NDP-sugar synthase, partial [candidate division Zixibacteria bacterium]|nr:NDP-sugar synthase [candidate division Zixibacteria bacterium]
MKTVIMAGGFGTRLRPLTCNLPKPMISIANKPMMEHILTLLKKHNLVDVLTLLYFQGEEIKNYFGDGSKFGVNIQYFTATEDYGTAGSVKNAEKLLFETEERERFLIISGDVLTDINLSNAIDFHLKSKSMATMILSRKENPLSYGVVITEEDGKISRFMEKPTWGEVFSDTVNTGIYILEPEVLEKIPPLQEYDFSKELFPLILAERGKLYGYITTDYWRDVGNLSEYSQAQQDILEGKVKIEIEGNLLKRKEALIWVGKNVQVGKDVEFKGNIILGNDSNIGSNSKISNSIIGEGVQCGEGITMNRSVVWKDSFIGSKAILSETIVSFKTIVGEGSNLLENSVISENCIIGSRAKVYANVKVWPGKEVESDAILASSLVWGEKWNRELFTDAK